MKVVAIGVIVCRHLYVLTVGLAISLIALLAACSPYPPVFGAFTTGTPIPTYQNPVYAHDFPDPFILRVGDVYYGFSTNVGPHNVSVIRSTDLAHWEPLGDALPILPDWAAAHQFLTWAPGVLPRGDQFILYYVARYRKAGRQCISRAIANRPEGPYTDDSTEPFICQTEIGGSIDPYPFVDDDGQVYLFWKNDGNCCGKPVGLWVQQLNGDGLNLIGEPVELIRKDQLWEEPLIENPAVWKHNGVYYLLYSANWWESNRYAVGYAVCEKITGPCIKPEPGPILRSFGSTLGPGGEAFFTDTKGNLWLAYHAWTTPKVGYPVGARSLHIDRITFEDGKPVIHGPTETPQPLL